MGMGIPIRIPMGTGMGWYGDYLKTIHRTVKDLEFINTKVQTISRGYD